MRHALLAPLALIATGGAVCAQGFGDPLITATIAQSFEADTNYDLDDPSPGTSYFTDTRLLFGLLNETQTQTFALGFDTGLRALWQAEEDFEFTFASPSTASLDYGYDWASGSLDTLLRYRQTEVDTTTLLIEDFDTPGAPDDIREVDGDVIERRYDAGVALEFATDSPSSYALDLAATRFDYSEDTDDDTPRTTLDGEALWRLQLTPVIAGALGGAYFYYSADNTEETQIREAEIDAGVIYDPSETLELRLGVGYANYTREELRGERRQTIRDDSGFVLNGRLQYLFEEITVTANARLTNAAPETRLSGDVRASYPLPNGAVNGRVFQRYGGGGEGDEIRVTGAVIGLTREINTVSQFDFDVAAARQENLDTAERDTDRLDFTATYSYALTEAVSANVGYRFRARDRDPESATSNAVFVEIGRTFETRP